MDPEKCQEISDQDGDGLRMKTVQQLLITLKHHFHKGCFPRLKYEKYF